MGDYMFIFCGGLIILLAISIIVFSINKRKLPNGILEWAVLLLAVAILTTWSIKGV